MSSQRSESRPGAPTKPKPGFEERPHIADQKAIIRNTKDGRFDRKTSEFRDWVKDEPDARFRPEKDRYHLYVAWACPWAHRTLIHRKLLGLEGVFGTSVVHWLMQDDGSWVFDSDAGYPDDLHDHDSLQEVYHQADASYGGVGTVPVLWDKKEGTIVNNESREIVKMMDTVFLPLQDEAHRGVTLRPDGMEDEVENAIDAIYEPINNGVYKSGFAKSQEAYEEAVTTLFDHLARFDDLLSGQRYLAGDGTWFTEADVFLFTTLLRFDPVYHYHFKCNLKRLRDFHHLWNHTLETFQVPGVAETVDMHDIKHHYFGSHTSINPYRIVPKGPEIDMHAKHDRGERFGGDVTRIYRRETSS